MLLKLGVAMTCAVDWKFVRMRFSLLAVPCPLILVSDGLLHQRPELSVLAFPWTLFDDFFARTVSLGVLPRWPW